MGMPQRINPSRQANGRFGVVHAGKWSPLYSVWCGINRRCFNRNEQKYSIYVGRGITVCDEWKDFQPFESWALANGYQKGLQIDRIDVNGDYGPNNCRFVTALENNNNRRNNVPLTAFGETKNETEWSRDPRCMVSGGILCKRIREGWSNEMAISTPRRKPGPKPRRLIDAIQ